MIYVAPPSEPSPGPVLTVETSAFAPPPALMRDWLGRRLSRAQFEREYRAQLRVSYRTHHHLWVDLVEQAALEDLWLAGEPTVAEVLRACLIRAGAERGLPLDPDEDDLGRTLLESTRMKLLAQSATNSENPVPTH